MAYSTDTTFQFEKEDTIYSLFTLRDIKEIGPGYFIFLDQMIMVKNGEFPVRGAAVYLFDALEGEPRVEDGRVTIPRDKALSLIDASSEEKRAITEGILKESFWFLNNTNEFKYGEPLFDFYGVQESKNGFSAKIHNRGGTLFPVLRYVTENVLDMKVSLVLEKIRWGLLLDSMKISIDYDFRKASSPIDAYTMPLRTLDRLLVNWAEGLYKRP